jgi:hypothetical protein
VGEFRWRQLDLRSSILADVRVAPFRLQSAIAEHGVGQSPATTRNGARTAPLSYNAAACAPVLLKVG